MERSGVSTCFEPSICDWKVTPVSSRLRSFAKAHDLEAA